MQAGTARRSTMGGSRMERFIAAAIQMDSGSDLEENLAIAAKLVDEAAGRGARLVAMPENVN